MWLNLFFLDTTKKIGTALSKLRKSLWNIEKLIDSNTRKAVCSPELLGVYCRTLKYSSNIESDVVILLSSDFYLKTLTRPSKYSTRICACMFYLGTDRKPLFYMKNHKKKNSKATWGDDIKFVEKVFKIK